MPELPEVQTVVSDLNKKIKGKIIIDFWSDWEKTIKELTVEKFTKLITGQKILKIYRLGKNIFLDLSNGKTLYIHLKMTGHLLVKKREKNNTTQGEYFQEKVNQYIHHIFYLKDKLNKKKNQKENKEYDLTLEFSDLRKFAKIVLIDTQSISALPVIKKLGIDAVSEEFTFKKFQEILQKKNSKGQLSLKTKKIGIILMEQELIAGIGNIYRSEILFEAGIHPERLVKDLKEIEIKRIYQATKKILKKAIKMRGTSDSDYRDTEGAPGNFQKVLKVYKKEGEKCPRCWKKNQKSKATIQREKLAQRSIFFCLKCQK